MAREKRFSDEIWKKKKRRDCIDLVRWGPLLLPRGTVGKDKVADGKPVGRKSRSSAMQILHCQSATGG